jgi:WD40 repeat protein
MPGKLGSWSPDGSRLIVLDVDETSAGSGKDTASIYDASSGEILFTLPVASRPTGETFLGYGQWSPDGRMVATSTDQGFGENNLIEVWDTATWERLYTLRGMLFSWSPDGDRVATTQQDGRVLVYTLAGDLVFSITTPDEMIDRVEWSPDGRYLMTSDKRFLVKVWRVTTSTQDLLDYAQECCVLRQLTDAERAQFGLAASDR